MASTQPAKRDEETDLISAEIQPVITPTQNTDLENQTLGDEPPTDPPSNPNKLGSFCMPVCKLLRYLIICLLCVCLSPVAYACVTAATIVLLPLLLAAFVVVRLIQFAIKSENFSNQFRFVMLLRYWIFIVVMLLLVEVGLFYPLAKYIPGLKPVTILGLSITMWIKIVSTLIGFYLLSQVIWLCLNFTVLRLIKDENESALVIEALSEIIACLLVLWAEFVVMNSVPAFKQSKVFGVYTQIWIRPSFYVLIGYNIITLLTHLFVWSLSKYFGDGLVGETFQTYVVCYNEFPNNAFSKRYVVYIAYGIKRSIIFLLSALMLLFTWLLHMGDYLKTTSEDKKVFQFGTWTLITVLMCSFLWLIKSCLLLYWEVHAVYDRLYNTIANVGKQLYFLVLLSFYHYEWVFEFSDYLPKDSSCGGCTPPKKKSLWIIKKSDSEGGEYCVPLERKIVRGEFMKFVNKEGLNSIIHPKASIYDIQKVAQRFLSAQFMLSKQSMTADLFHLHKDNSEEHDENGVSHLPDDNSNQNNERLINTLKKIIHDEGCPNDWEMFLELLHPDEHAKKSISFQKVKTWMERAQNRCVCLANTLISEKEVVECLDQVISGVIIGASFIMWLLLTGLATTKVLVLVASPFLAATFIFGDTCKSLFQGLIFVYVVQPFNVGDLCYIDEKLLEVKRITVWSTIFSKVRTVDKQEEVIYPNSELATKNVVNYKTAFDWNDYIECYLSFRDEETTKKLKHQIETYVKSRKGRFTPNFFSMEFLEIGDKDKVAIHVHHKVNAAGWTYSECLKKKEKRRFKFVLYLRNLLNQPEFKTKDPEEIRDD